jgi:hypothetical protein
MTLGFEEERQSLDGVPYPPPLTKDSHKWESLVNLRDRRIWERIA